MQSANKKILLFTGGVMSGVFGAGVVTQLQKENAYDNIEAIYGVSAGAIDAAYFLAKQSAMGSTIYYKDLIHNFIDGSLIPLGIAQRFINRYIKPLPEKSIVNPVDIGYLFKVMRTTKKLNVKTIQSQSIPLYVSLLNTETKDVEYHDVRTSDTLDLLKASVTTTPYYFPATLINNIPYVDGAIKDPYGLATLYKRHPNHTIIMIMNQQPYVHPTLIWLRDFARGVVANTMYQGLYNTFMHRERLRRREFEDALHSHNIIPIYPTKHEQISGVERNPKKLIRAYKTGMRYGQKVVKILKEKT